MVDESHEPNPVNCLVNHCSPATAIENYMNFPDLWKDADHGKAEVDDRRGRLAGLKENA